MVFYKFQVFVYDRFTVILENIPPKNRRCLYSWIKRTQINTIPPNNITYANAPILEQNSQFLGEFMITIRMRVCVCVVYVFMAVVCNVLERTSARKSFVVIWLMDLFSLPFLTLSLCVVAFWNFFVRPNNNKYTRKHTHTYSFSLSFYTHA